MQVLGTLPARAYTGQGVFSTNAYAALHSHPGQCMQVLGTPCPETLWSGTLCPETLCP